MTLYLLQVYRGASYYPDRTCKATVGGVWKRRARQLEREGFSVKLLALTAQGRLVQP